jgi:hypothetical protein
MRKHIRQKAKDPKPRLIPLNGIGTRTCFDEITSAEEAVCYTGFLTFGSPLGGEHGEFLPRLRADMVAKWYVNVFFTIVVAFRTDCWTLASAKLEQEIRQISWFVHQS